MSRGSPFRLPPPTVLVASLLLAVASGARPFTLRFTDGAGGALPSAATPRLNLIRIE